MMQSCATDSSEQFFSGFKSEFFLRPVALSRLQSPVSPTILSIAGRRRILAFLKYDVKLKQPHPGFELCSSSHFPKMITNMPWAIYVCMCINIYIHTYIHTQSLLSTPAVFFFNKKFIFIQTKNIRILL